MKYEVNCKQSADAVNSDYKKVYICRPTTVFPIVIWTRNFRLSTCTNQCLSCYRKAWNRHSFDIFTYIVAIKVDSFFHFSIFWSWQTSVRRWQRCCMSWSVKHPLLRDCWTTETMWPGWAMWPMGVLFTCYKHV
jgi:hypothetical protein